MRHCEVGNLKALMAAGPQTITDLWRTALTSHSDRPLLISDEDGGILTYDEAAVLVGLTQRRLAAAGVGPGDRVALIAPVHPEIFVAFWAAVMMGAIAVPLDHRLPADKSADLIALTEPRLVFVDRERRPVIPAKGDSVVVVLDDPTQTGSAPADSFSVWLDEDKAESPTNKPCTLPEDPAVILFTSGTSGEAKGVMLSHGALCRSGQLMSSMYGWGPDDILFSLGDLHTMSGLRNPAIAAVHAGCSFVTAAASTRGSAICAAGCVEKHGITLMTTVPAMLNLFIRSGDRIPPGCLAPLRQVLSTGSVLPSPLVRAFEARFGVQVLNYYGLTETAGLCIGELPGESRKEPGNIGLPVGSEARIVDETGTPLPVGEVGELQIRTSNIMTGYYRNPQRTKEALSGNWYRTGDLARLTADGRIVLLDRMVDLVKDARGDFIFPGEIEQLLESHPSVVEAGVSAERSFMGDLKLSALLVTATPDPLTSGLIDELRRHVACRLGPTKVPARFFQVRELPRGVNGKLLRRKFSELLPYGEG